MASITEGITYSSSLEKVASVTSDGTITAVKPGSATITATYQGKQTDIKIKVFNSHKEKSEDSATEVAND
ncbi:Bacterial Ig-like domain (group 2) [compost metagenome]